MRHFQEDYTKLVADLLANYPEEEAMERAVGGAFVGIGDEEVALLRRYGLKPDMLLVDVGCGSGRLPTALIRAGWEGYYVGMDVILTLVEYARKLAYPRWVFRVSDGQSIDMEEADMICFFSVFTHLKPEESYVYLEQARKALRPGGRVVLSYLDYHRNWDVFDAMAEHVRQRIKPVHLNTFLHAEHLTLFATRAGFRVVEFATAEALGQSVVVLEK